MVKNKKKMNLLRLLVCITQTLSIFCKDGNKLRNKEDKQNPLQKTKYTPQSRVWEKNKALPYHNKRENYYKKALSHCLTYTYKKHHTQKCHIPS